MIRSRINQDPKTNLKIKSAFNVKKTVTSQKTVQKEKSSRKVRIVMQLLLSTKIMNLSVSWLLQIFINKVNGSWILVAHFICAPLKIISLVTHF